MFRKRTLIGFLSLIGRHSRQGNRGRLVKMFNIDVASRLDLLDGSHGGRDQMNATHGQTLIPS